MSNPVILCADSTCDLGPKLLAQYNVHLYPFHIVLDDQTYQDGIDLNPEDIVRIYQEKKILPRTAAINVQEYLDFFKPFVDDGYDVIHISLGSGISSSHQNACLAAAEYDGRVFAINSGNLSTGSGHLVLEAGKRIAAGLPAAQIAEEVSALRPKVVSSFIIDTLEFLHKGGRCSTLEMMGANLLKLKPCIRVNNEDSSMSAAKKYRGTLEKVIAEYIKDELEGRDDIVLDKVFVTHSPMDEALVQKAVEIVKQYQNFENIYVESAGCTITSHCGPNTLGVLYMVK